MSELSNLPDVQFSDLDAQGTVNDIISLFETASRLAGVINYKLYPGDPRRLFLNSVAKCIVLLNHKINEAGKMNLLKYAFDAFLDQLSAIYGKRGQRLKASAAVTTLQYTLSQPQESDIFIPKGSRVSPGNNIFFATSEPAVIRRGEWSTTVEAECMSTGTIGNDFEPGEINIIVDRNNPFVQSAINITKSSLGSDVEDDESYRERLYILPESFSVAGPHGAYEFWAKSTSQEIVDVSVWSPEITMELWEEIIKIVLSLAGDSIDVIPHEWSLTLKNSFEELCRVKGTGPGHVRIAPLMKGGELPTQDVMNKVYETCNDREVRPLTDYLSVVSPKKIEYDLDFTYYIPRQLTASLTQTQLAVEKATSDYILWQKEKLHRDVNPDELTELVKKAGAKRLEIRSPQYMVMEHDEVAVARSVNIIYGGIEDGY